MGDGPDYDSMYEGRDIQDAYEEDVYRAEMNEAYDDDNYSRYSSNKPSQSSDGCFIATAAYGSPLEIEVIELKIFRDKTLLKNKIGRLLVQKYYLFSPPVATAIKDNKFAKILIRLTLKPIILFVKWHNSCSI